MEVSLRLPFPCPQAPPQTNERFDGMGGGGLQYDRRGAICGLGSVPTSQGNQGIGDWYGSTTSSRLCIDDRLCTPFCEVMDNYTRFSYAVSGVELGMSFEYQESRNSKTVIRQ